MIKYPKRELTVISECNDEYDNPTCWAMSCGKDGDGHEHFVWICKYADDEYIVENSNGFNLANEKYKTLWGAKRNAEKIAWIEENNGVYTD